LKLDSAKFPEQGLLKSGNVMGRLTVSAKQGDTDNDGDIDELYMNGSRGFSIWDATTGKRVYHSGNDFERLIASDPVWKAFFNANNSVGSPGVKNRSDNKGPEPEGVATAVINDTTYAFVSLERVGGVMVYDISKPNAPVLVNYANNRTLAGTGDFGPEGIIFIPADQSPNGKHLLVLSNEISATLSIYEFNTSYPVARLSLNLTAEVLNERNEFSELRWSIQPPLAYPATLVIHQQRAPHTALSEFTTSPVFTGDSLSIRLAPGASTGSITITTIDDQLAQPNDTIIYRGTLKGFLAGNGAVVTRRLVILDDDASQGIAAPSLPTLKVYPNPASAVLHLGTTVSRVRVLDQKGASVLYSERVRSINTNGISPGTYVLEAEGFAPIRFVVMP
jgi:hypothetical protein